MAEQTSIERKHEAPLLVSNWFGILGAILAASSLFAALCLIAIDLFRGFPNAYMGVLTYLVAPAFLVSGLALMAIGGLWERRRRRRAKPGEVLTFPRIDFNDPEHRRTFFVVAIVAFVFFLITALGSYRTYQFTDSVAFCGRVCHTVMKPEYTAYQGSPHARVACAECHIGPGATWFVKAKLSGVYQVYATIADKHPRPIPAPVQNLRPAQETCEECHWPGKFYDASERVVHHYLPRETNPLWTIRMLLKIGGGDPEHGLIGGIHWHMNIAHKVEYIPADEKRQVIPWVRVTDQQGKATVYRSSTHPLSPDQIAAAKPRSMDCIDCHNRPTHVYRSPIQSVDKAINTGRIDPSVPFIKQQAVLALTKPYLTTEQAVKGIADTLSAFYQQSDYAEFAKAKPALVERAISEVQAIYTSSFFPEMKVNWRAYPDNIGHMNFPGCDRCHDGDHKSDDGKTIVRDCNACHTITAQGSGDKLTTVAAEGLEFKHPVNIGPQWKEMRCSECHTGALVE